jgi:hypothetical protein
MAAISATSTLPQGRQPAVTLGARNRSPRPSRSWGRSPASASAIPRTTRSTESPIRSCNAVAPIYDGPTHESRSAREGDHLWRSRWHAPGVAGSSGPRIGTRAGGRSARCAARRSSCRSRTRRGRTDKRPPHRRRGGPPRRRARRGLGQAIVESSTWRRRSGRSGRRGTSPRRDITPLAHRTPGGTAPRVGEAHPMSRGTTSCPGPWGWRRRGSAARS